MPEDFRYITEQLLGKYQVIVFHQRGTGRSPCPEHNYTMEAYISDIHAIAAHYRLTKFHLFGHSWGGLYGELYAQYYPGQVLSLFLSGPCSGTGKHWKESQDEIKKYTLARSTAKEWLTMGVNSMLAMAGSDAAAKKMQKQTSIIYNRGYPHDETAFTYVDDARALPTMRTGKYISRYPLLRNWDAPRFPVTITYGDNDLYGDSKKYVFQRFPFAAVHIIPRAGHVTWLHNPTVFFLVLAEHYHLTLHAQARQRV